MISAEQLHASRAEQRKQRLLDVEREQAEEEAEALKMTEEQRQILLRPFQSVKAEFTDLDGMRWTQTALRRFDQQASSPSTTTSASSAKFVVLTNSDLASFHPDDTITLRRSASTSSSSTRPQEMCRHRDGTKSRSPVKGLFASTSRPPGLEPAPAYEATASLAPNTPATSTRHGTPHYTNIPRRRSSSSSLTSSSSDYDSASGPVSLLDQPTKHRRRDSDAPTPLNARVRLAALLSHSSGTTPSPPSTYTTTTYTPQPTRPPPTPPILPSIVTSLPVSHNVDSTIRPSSRRRPALPSVPAMTSRTTSGGLRGWSPSSSSSGSLASARSSGLVAPYDGDDSGYMAHEHGWDSDAEDEETPRPSPVDDGDEDGYGGPVSPSRGWIRGFS